VFRLVAQDTLEERIMGLQAFKKRVAASLVAADPSATQSGAADALASLSQAFGKP
jgi:SNF2 family DNA or RNA helicase